MTDARHNSNNNSSVLSSPAADAVGPTTGHCNVRLLRYLVFNSTFGPKEGEEEKRIIFYHPQDEEPKLKHRNVGFAAACTSFLHTFFDDDGFGEGDGTKKKSGSRKTRQQQDCKSVHTQKTKTVFLQPEPEFWLSLTVSLPYHTRKSKSGAGGEIVEYSPDDVHDSVLLSQLTHSYEMFRFFMGPFQHVLDVAEDGDRDRFKARVSSFLSKFIHTIRPAHAGILELFRAIQFLTLEPGAFLRVQGFVNRIEDEFPQVSKMVFFQQGNIVWTELQQEDTRLLYYYITSSLLPSSVLGSTRNTAGATGISADPPRSPFSGHQGRFLAGGGGPSALHVDAAAAAASSLKVYLQGDGDDGDDEDGRGGSRKEHHLVVYHAVSSTVCLLVPATADLSPEFFRQLDALMGPHLTNMSADLMDVFGHGNRLTTSMSIPKSLSSAALDMSSSPSVKFIYFNKFNCAMKSTLQQQANGGGGGGGGDNGGLSPDVMKMMLDLSENFEKMLAKDKVEGLPIEAFIKMSNEQWVIGRSTDQRQVFVAITSKCSTLMDANEEVNRLIASEFRNVCLLAN